MERIKETKEKNEDELLSKANVIGVETGLKEINNKEINELAIIVHVKNKVPEAELEEEDIIPKEIESIKTDVIKTGEITIPPLMKVPNKERTEKWRPIPMGVSTGHPEITAGSFGSTVRRNNILMGLSNNHVWANCNKADENDPLLQPGKYDEGELPDDKFGILYDYVPIKIISNSNCPVAKGIKYFLNGLSKLFGRETRFKIETKPVKNEVDAALGKPLNQDEIAPYVLGPKNSPSRRTTEKTDDGYEKLYHRGSREAEVGEEVWTSGRTLGYVGKETGAKVKSTDATIQVRYPSGIALFKNQIHIKSEKKFSAGGMSGACVAGQRDDAVLALLFAGSKNGLNTFCNNIKTVEEKLNCKVVDIKTKNK